MNSVKCVNCGLTYWTTVPNCKRCGTPTSDNENAQRFNAPPQRNQSSVMSADGFLSDADEAKKAKMLKDIKGGAGFFYFIGGLQIVLWFVIGQLLIVDGIVNIALAALVQKFKSRVAAVLLMLLTLLSILALFAAKAGGGNTPGMLFPIGMIVRVIVSFRLVYNTFKVREYLDAEAVQMMPPPPPVFQQPQAYPQSQVYQQPVYQQPAYPQQPHFQQQPAQQWGAPPPPPMQG